MDRAINGRMMKRENADKHDAIKFARARLTEVEFELMEKSPDPGHIKAQLELMRGKLEERF